MIEVSLSSDDESAIRGLSAVSYDDVPNFKSHYQRKVSLNEDKSYFDNLRKSSNDV